MMENYDGFTFAYPTFENIIPLADIPEIEYGVFYRRDIYPDSAVDSDLQNLLGNIVIKLKQIERFARHLLHSESENVFKDIALLEDLDPMLLRVIYDQINKTFELGKLLKDLKRRNKSRVKIFKEYLRNISSELLQIMHTRLEEEAIDYFLTPKKELFVSLHEFKINLN